MGENQSTMLGKENFECQKDGAYMAGMKDGLILWAFIADMRTQTRQSI